MITIDGMIEQSREMANQSRVVLPEVSKDNDQIADWLEELKTFRGSQQSLGTGISICILTYNVLFYNKLAIKQIRAFTKLIPYEILVLDNGSDDGSVEWLSEQPDVKLIRRGGDFQIRHGVALDYLVKNIAKYPITCALCSDAFPTSPEWLAPAFYLSDEVLLSGIGRGCGRTVENYVCPSYLFGWTDWLKNHSFLDNWPNIDTGEQLSKDCLDSGKKIKVFPITSETFDGRYSPKNCNYNGWVWHVWWGGRYKTSPAVIGIEVEQGYHEFMVEYLRNKHNLDF